MIKFICIKEGRHIHTSEVRGVETRHGQPTTDQQGCHGPGMTLRKKEDQQVVTTNQSSEEKKELNWAKTNETLALLAVAFTNDLVKKSCYHIYIVVMPTVAI